MIKKSIQELKNEFCVIEKFTIKIEAIEMIVDKLPTTVMFFSFLFASFECQRLRWILGGNDLDDRFYHIVLLFSFISGIFGIISICMKIR